MEDLADLSRMETFHLSALIIHVCICDTLIAEELGSFQVTLLSIIYATSQEIIMPPGCHLVLRIAVEIME